MNIKQRFLKFRTHRKLFYLILFLIIVLILYIIFALCVSITLNGIIKKAINDEPYDNSLAYIVSEENYEFINPIQPECEEGITVETERSNTFPFVLPFFTDAYYRYTYIVTDTNTNEVVYGSVDGQVTIKLDYSSFPVHISDVIVAP